LKNLEEVARRVDLIFPPCQQGKGGERARRRLSEGREEWSIFWPVLEEKSRTRYDDILGRLEGQVCTETPQCERCPVQPYCGYFRRRCQRRADHVPLATVVDLFCGAGGLSLGFRQEGFTISMANDIEPCCIDTYRFNHPELPERNIICGDINKILPDLPRYLRFPQTDVVIGGPPCQGFSMANRQRLIDDPRNRLYQSFVRSVSLLNPRFVVMENVRGMAGVAPQVVEDFAAIGYTVTPKLLNARQFGVPQHRERLIFIGSREGKEHLPVLESLSRQAGQGCCYVLADALYGLRPLEASRIPNTAHIDSESSGKVIDRALEVPQTPYLRLINGGEESPFVFNHKARYNNDRDIEIFRRLEPGDRSDDPKIADIMPYASRNHIFRDKYFKLEPDRPCKTITAHMKFDCNMYIHPSQSRGLTPREAARVQSYPDWYFFTGPYTKTFMQIGNSVPPLFSRAIARAIREVL
jgi:DNA (cytosine-5)-methyltransferase 1